MRNWETFKLDDLCEFKNGLWTGKKPPYQNVGVIRNTNFTKNGCLDDSDIAFLEVEIKQYATRKLEPGDIILEKSGGGPKQPVGRVVLFTKNSGDFSFSNFTSVIRIRNKEKTDCRYLHKILHFFYISGFTETMQTHSTGIRNLQLKEYKNIEIPIPPLPEQKRIVSIVDEAFEGIDRAIANTEKNLANARELFKGYLNAVFTQKSEGVLAKKLGEICKFEDGDRGKNYPNREEYVESGIPWINTGHIQPDGTLSQSKMNFITREKYESLRSGKIQPGDLVYCLRGATIGKTALVDPLTIGAVASSLVIIRPGEQLESYFLYYFLTSPVGQRLIKLYDNGAAQPNLGAKSVAKYIIFLPKLAEQKVIVQKLTALSNETQCLEVIYKQKLAALNELKQSILQKAFTGELTADTANQTIKTTEVAIS